MNTATLTANRMLATSLADLISSTSDVTCIIISIAIMLMCGFLMTRLTKKLKLPNVTAYIVTGILLGPFCFKVVPQKIVDGTEFLADIALAFIAFSAGEFFKFSKLKNSVGKVVVITLLESLLASLLVFILTYWILGLSLAFSIVLAALASATAPASTMMTIRQTNAKGDFVDTLLQVVAYDDIVALLAYSVAISIAVSSQSEGGFKFADIIIPIVENLGMLALGCGFGLLMKLFIHKKRSTDNRLIIAIALIFAFCGVCAALDVSPLLGCMAMGTVYINVSDDDKLFKQLNYFSPPILLLFFVRSGLSFNLNALIHPSGEIGSVSLLWIGILYFIVRIIGKYAGAYIGGLVTKKPKETRNYLGLALIPQAGVAIGLAALGARTLQGAQGDALYTIIMASSVLYELIGPVCAKLALYLSKSYSTKLEDLAPIPELTAVGTPKSTVDMLIERIQIIQSELKKEPFNEEEQAFTEAAEEHLMSSGDEIAVSIESEDERIMKKLKLGGKK